MLRRRCGLRRIQALRLVLGCTAFLTAPAISCIDLTAPLPSGAIEWSPPARYALWWQMTESCSGRQGDRRAIRWYVVPNATSIDNDGHPVQGLWTSNPNRIVLVESYRFDGALVRHEMLHALLRAGRHPATFLTACSDVVACDDVCEKEAGGRDTPPSDAPELTPRDLLTRVEIAPQKPAASQDSGAVAVIVSITNPLSRPAWVRLTPQDVGDPFAHTFGVMIDYNDPNSVGMQDYAWIMGTRFPLGAKETRRFVWDDVLGVGSYGIRGYFNDDTVPRFVLSVGP